MKTQTSGVGAIDELDEMSSIGRPIFMGLAVTLGAVLLPFVKKALILNAARTAISQAILRGEEASMSSITMPDGDMVEPVIDYYNKRANGGAQDRPSRDIPLDGQFKITNLGIGGLALTYYEGPQDRQWMAEKDLNYQTRLARERLANASQLKTTMIENVIAQIGSANTVNFFKLIATIENQADRDAQASDWYTHPDLPIGTTAFDFCLNVDDVERLMIAIRNNPAIKTLNFSNIDLSGDLRALIIRLFRARNDFTVISLANTRLTNEGLFELLNALYDGKDTTRKAPLIEKFNIADNQITSIHLLIDFIYNCARKYYFQHRDAAAESPLSLTKVNLKCNLIFLTENSDSVLRSCVARLQERHGTLPHLTIRLSGNIIQINVPNPFQEIRQDMWQYEHGFFVTKHLERRESIMQPGKYLTPMDGFIYLVCAQKPEGAFIYFGHASIFTERLNEKGQLELKKLEFGVAAACGTSGGGGINIEQLDALRLLHKRGKLNFQAWPVKSYLIQQLIDIVEGSRTSDVVKYSSIGIFGESCITWVIDKLKGIGLEVDKTIFPTKAAGAEKRCALM